MIYRTKVKFGIVLLMSLSLTTVLSGCTPGTGLRPLPDKERYQFINKVKDDMDYASAGKVVEEHYTDTDGVFNASAFVVNIEGDDSFDVLSNRTKELSNGKCYNSPAPATGDQTYCSIGHVKITVYRETSESDKIQLVISDAYSGRAGK